MVKEDFGKSHRRTKTILYWQVVGMDSTTAAMHDWRMRTRIDRVAPR